MRIPNVRHEAGGWLIREIVPDFVLEDVWALPIHGAAGEFDAVIERLATFDPAATESLPARFLWRARDVLGRWFGLDEVSGPPGAHHEPLARPIPETDESSLAGRLPADLRGTAADVAFGSVPFTPLYRTETEFAAEISNRTVHGVLHLAWADRERGRHQAEMAIYVKPRGALGRGYMACIRPFRYLVVYPALMRQIGKAWTARASA